MSGVAAVADIVFAALDAKAHAPDMRPYRLELYLARAAIDHGRRALAALRGHDIALFEAHLLAYGRIARGLIEIDYWERGAMAQIGWGQSCA